MVRKGRVQDIPGVPGKLADSVNFENFQNIYSSVLTVGVTTKVKIGRMFLWRSI
jgi:hypothetical protein